MSRRVTILAPAVALLLVFAGCGGDDDASDDTTTTEQQETTQAETTEAETTESTEGDTTGSSKGDDPGDTGDTTEPEDPSGTTEGDAPTGEAAEFCAAFAALGEDFGDQTAPTTIEETRAFFAMALSDAENTADLAPDEIADDFQTVVDGFSELNDIVAAAPTLEAAEAAVTGFDDTEIKPASDRIEAWIDENCPES